MTAAASSPAARPAPVAWADGDLIVTRDFAAPREVVFAAWAQPEQFARWWGPLGSTMLVRALDVRPGGAIHFCHRFPDHPDVWVGGEYREVRAPERIAFTAWFSDADGGRVDRPGFPAEMTITVTFVQHAEGTRITARHVGLVQDQGEVQGWMEALDRLATLLAASHTSTGANR